MTIYTEAAHETRTYYLPTYLTQHRLRLVPTTYLPNTTLVRLVPTNYLPT